MKFIKQVTYVVSASSLLIGLVATPVFAHNGVDHSSDDSGNSSGSTSSGRGSTNDVKSVHEANEHAAGDDNAKAAFQSQAQQQIAELKSKIQQRSAEARQKSCDANKKGAETRISAISTNVSRFQNKLDSTFTKTQSYVTSKNLTVANYDALTAAVREAQNASAESIATLTNLKPTIDCSQSTNAENIAAYRSAAQDTRDKLKAYVGSLKDLLKAVRDAKQSNAEGSAN